MPLYTVEYAPSIQIGAMDRLNIVLYMLGEGHNMTRSEYDQFHALLYTMQIEASCHNRFCKYCK
jgi:hypothetical protein|nr:MAG TPA: hypothetical protein [Bacteriophage sp.]